MKLIMAVIQDQDVRRLLDRLMSEGFGATKLASTGGFLREGNSTVLVGTEEEHLEKALQIIRECCHSRVKLVNPIAGIGASIGDVPPPPVEVPVGGAAIFVLEVAHFEKV